MRRLTFLRVTPAYSIENQSLVTPTPPREWIFQQALNPFSGFSRRPFSGKQRVVQKLLPVNLGGARLSRALTFLLAKIPGLDRVSPHRWTGSWAQCANFFAKTLSRCFLALALSLPLVPLTVAGALSADAEFEKIAEAFVPGYLAWRPQVATALGLHEYDGKITDFNATSIDNELGRLQRFEERLTRLKTNSLSPQAFYECRILQTAIRTELLKFEDLGIYTNNPMTYAGAFDVNIYVKRNFAPLEKRVQAITSILSEAPKVMAAARANLAESLPRPFVETAIEVGNGAISFLEKDLVEALKDFHDEGALTAFRVANQMAAAELRAFVTYLEKEKLPRAHLRYALGPQRYKKMLEREELIKLSPDRLLQIGLEELRREQALFAEAARQIDPAKKPIDVFREIQKDHPTAENLIPETKKNLDAIRQFLIERKIITLPSEVRVRVEETPAFARATSFASMDTPGPFETRATEAYYYVTPVETNWTEKQKEEWLTAFNYYTTDVVSIHEAYPGHYTQFLCLNASPAGKRIKMFQSYAFVEGWAHYAEQMMLEEGFGAAGSGSLTAADRIKAAKYRLAQSDEALLRLCRLCVSIKTHCFGMSLDEATQFFEENCYYEPKPARQEALRGTFDPEYLYYTLGKLQILKLRRDYQKQEGAAFSLQKFHDEMLRHGMPPLRLLREVMLKEPKVWDEIF